MCIKCVEGSFPGQRITYTDYNGPRIQMGQFADSIECEKYIADKFDGALPCFIDTSLVGTFKVQPL